MNIIYMTSIGGLPRRDSQDREAIGIQDPSFRTYIIQRRYDMNERSHMQEGKNCILPKEINANRFF
jgi:hypothetical protein